MSEPKNNPPEKDGFSADKDDKKESDNILKILDDLLSHTNSSRRLFLIFIASALFFGPAALILGGVLLGHPDYNIKQLETQQGSGNELRHIPPGSHIQLVDKNGTAIKDLTTILANRPHNTFIFTGLRVFIIISIIFSIILLLVAIKEYKFISHWNKRFIRYKSLKDKVDKELDED
jgi:hypothetical protein